MKNRYEIIKRRYITEKTAMLESLKNATSNRCVSRCENPKYAFLVDVDANKAEIAEAVEAIYAEQNVKVLRVNTVMMKPKIRNRRGRMNPGKSIRKKKAIVTLAVGNSIE